MIRSKNFKQKWLPLALVPLFSVTVLAGCDSDDDDDGGDTTPVVDVDTPVDTDSGDTDTGTGDTTATDVNGNGIPDQFEPVDATDDVDGNGIADEFETGPDGAPITDENGNGIDDSFETTDADSDTGDTDTGDAGGGLTVDDQIGPLNEIPVGSAGIAALTWDGFNISGVVNMNDDVNAVSAGLYTGIAASGFVQPTATTLNGSGNANGIPTFFIPSGIAPDQSAVIAENIVSGNLFINVDFANGSSETGIILLNGVQPAFTPLSAENTVPAGEAFSNGEGFINVNTVTGDFTAVVNVNLNPADLDAGDNPETVSAVSINLGAADATGPSIVELVDTGNGRTWTTTGAFAASDLEMVLDGDSYFNVQNSGGSAFVRGQIQVPGQ